MIISEVVPERVVEQFCSDVHEALEANEFAVSAAGLPGRIALYTARVIDAVTTDSPADVVRSAAAQLGVLLAFAAELRG